MASYKSLLIIILCFVFCSCNDSGSSLKNLSLTTDIKENKVALGKSVSFSVNNPDNIEISKVTYKVNDETIESTWDTSGNLLGVHEVKAIIDLEDTAHELSTKITILNNELPKIYSYRIINEFPHDITSYTQGLEFNNGVLYESTGQYGESKLRRVDYKTGEILKNLNLDRQYFAEGLTILDSTIYQLTWQEGIGFQYDLASFEKKSSFKYGASKEGWGICNDGKQLYKSDGTEKIWSLDPENLVENSKIEVYTNKGRVIGLNELEWIDGKIFANRYQKNGVAIINPSNGAVEGVIDFTPLRSQVTQHQGLDVLNGIAFNPETRTIFVTGKRWDKLFEVEVFEK